MTVPTVPPDVQICGLHFCTNELTGETWSHPAHGDICEECAADLPRCNRCGDFDDDLTEDIYGEELCGGCLWSRYRGVECWDCERPGPSHDMRWNASGNRVCDDCAAANWWACDGCYDLINAGDYCESCEDDRDQSSDYVHDYGYRPAPNFLGDGPTYLGFELEINTPRHDLDDVARHAAERLDWGRIGYLKEDSSIPDAGFEIVTHPMSHAWASRHFPWELLDELKDQACSAETYDDGLGLHVHVSRAGFDGPAHVLRWLQLFYDNSDRIDAIARRRNGEWAAWSSTDRSKAKEYAKGETYGRRYSAINVQNDATFEVRVFASTLRRTELRAALDLIAASVEATREATAPAATIDPYDDAAWDTFAESDAYRVSWDDFAAYVAERDAYAALHTMLTEGS